MSCYGSGHFQAIQLCMLLQRYRKPRHIDFVLLTMILVNYLRHDNNLLDICSVNFLSFDFLKTETYQLVRY